MYCVPVGACVSSVVPWFFDVVPPDFCLVCAYEGGDLFVSLRYTVILWRVFACQVSVYYFVAYGLWYEFVCVVYPAYWYVFLACLIMYVVECLVCVMYVCQWLYCSEGVFCVLCEFFPVCLPEFSAWIVFQVVLL